LSSEVHLWLTWIVLGAAPVVAFALLFLSAPYGRHMREGWGPTVSNRVGWILMEIPSVLAFALFYAAGQHRLEPAALVLLLVWQLHYVHRTFVFPFRIRTSGKRMPLTIVGIALVFTFINGTINGHQAGHVGSYSLDQPTLWIGVAVFAVGFVINLHADTVLIGLRKPGETGYKIPRGGLYRWITCPNYFGELIEWLGWAIATWSLPGLAFFVYTLANLAPRAMQNHRWCREKFEDYPTERKALVPFVF